MGDGWCGIENAKDVGEQFFPFHLSNSHHVPAATSHLVKFILNIILFPFAAAFVTAVVLF
jgi:hypothetical protein